MKIDYQPLLSLMQEVFSGEIIQRHPYTAYYAEIFGRSYILEEYHYDFYPEYFKHAIYYERAYRESYNRNPIPIRRIIAEKWAATVETRTPNDFMPDDRPENHYRWGENGKLSVLEFSLDGSFDDFSTDMVFAKLFNLNL